MLYWIQLQSKDDKTMLNKETKKLMKKAATVVGRFKEAVDHPTAWFEVPLPFRLLAGIVSSSVNL